MKGITFPQAFRTAFQQPLTYIRKLRVKLVCKSHEYCDQTLNAKMRLVLFCHQDIFLSFLAMVRCKNKSFNKRFFSSLDFSTLISLDPDPRTRVQTHRCSARATCRVLFWRRFKTYRFLFPLTDILHLIVMKHGSRSPERGRNQSEKKKVFKKSDVNIAHRRWVNVWLKLPFWVQASRHPVT